MFPEPSSNDPGLAHAFHGWTAAWSLFVAYLVAVMVLAWCWNRRLRPVDRGSILPWPLLIGGFGLVLVLRHWPGGWAQAAAITAALIIAGLLARNVHPRGLWVPGVLLAALVGLGLHLSALLFFLVTVLAVLLSGERHVR
ncbi:MAG: hypothetical protein RBT71_01075 [Flavobacteriales bacterium]|jgi:hypothetical protein|nr:hypothetical protein [Flavobacteriales bacterium]